MAVKWAEAEPSDAALDVCCGSGDLAFVLAEAVGPSGMVSQFKLRLLWTYRPKSIAISALLECCAPTKDVACLLDQSDPSGKTLGSMHAEQAACLLMSMGVPWWIV